MDIYHYTKINTLNQIIKSKKIRFTRLDLLEDAYDGNLPNKDINPSNQFINSTYVACFTLTSEEHYPLWKLYDALDGVRFKLKSDLFGNTNLENNTTSLTKKIKLEYTHFGDDIGECLIDFLHGPCKINYSDEENAVICTKNNNEHKYFEIHFKNLIFSKLKFYCFENEIRFALAPNFNKIITDQNSHIVNNNVNKSREYIDIPFCKLIEEVVFGPRVDHCSDDIIKLKKKLMDYNIKMNIEQSKIVLREKRK